jgi:hypothetical protein
MGSSSSSGLSSGFGLKNKGATGSDWKDKICLGIY